VGRFLTADTVVPNSQNPQSFNRFSYTLNDPINLIDPSGHMPTDGCAWEGCLNDPDTWGANFVTYLVQKGTEDNPTGAFILNFFFSTADTLKLEERANMSIVEEVARSAIDASPRYLQDVQDFWGFSPDEAWRVQQSMGPAFVAMGLAGGSDDLAKPGRFGNFEFEDGLLRPGPYAVESIPASGRTITASQQREINRIGNT
jgi:hypothetical protein